MKVGNKRVLAIYPYNQGIAYALFESQKDMIDCGSGRIRPFTNKKVIDRIDHYLGYYRPDVVILKSPVIGKSARRKIRLLNLIKGCTRKQDLPIQEYSNADIKNVMEQFDCETKYQTSKKLCEWFPMIEKYRYAKRKPWEPQAYGVGVFDAASLGVAHFFLS